MGIKTVRASSQYITKSDPVNLPTGGTARCLMGWFDLVDTDPGGALLAYGIAASNEFSMMIMKAVGDVYLLGWGAGGLIITGADIPSTGLHHIAVGIPDSTHYYYYLDGVAKKSNALIGSTINTPTPTFLQAMKCPNTSYPYYNSLNNAFDLRIYNRLPSAEEIVTIYAARGNDNIVSGLVLRWLLNEFSDGATASGAGACKDYSGNGNHGTPTSSPVGVAAPVKLFKRR